MNTSHRLHELFKPSNYQLQLSMDRPGRTFKGTVTITGELLTPSSHIILHAKELSISEATVNGKTAIIHTEPNDYDEITLNFTAGLQSGQHTVQLAFSGVITDPMHGLYPSKTTVNGQAVEMLSTQFESHHAREVFPCIDDPAAKATFDLELHTEPDITVLGNMPVKNQTISDGSLVTVFETTPIMSTYLLAWVAGPLAYKEKSAKDGVAVRVYTTADKLAQVDFALDVGVRALEFYNDYFGVPYPLPKYDMAAIPDFSAGAMENWGLVTFRESVLLVDPVITPLINKQYVAIVVVHELAHQWFGNLVTMQWWDDLWLNESFANFMEYYVVDKLFPEWQLWLQFYSQETAGALDKDALASVQKVRQQVNHPDEIRTLFDGAIVYAKGGSLLRMLHAHMGDTDFRRGLQKYMQMFAYKNTVMDDLLESWSQTSGKDIAAFMQPWVAQAGHPLIRAEVGNNTVALQQQRFYSNPKEAPATDITSWPVPLLSDAVLGDLMTSPSQTFDLKSGQRPIQINRDRAGFYQIAYNEDHLKTLASAIEAGDVGVLDRLGLLNDSYDLARAGVSSAKHMLQLLEAYKHEAAEPVWSAIADCVGALKMFADDDEALLGKLRTFVGQLADEQFTRLSWDKIPGEPYFDELLRPAILGLMSFSEQPDVLRHAQELFAAADKPEDIGADIRRLVLSVAAKHGSDQDFAKILQWHDHTTSSQIRTQLIAGLTSTKDTDRIRQLLEMLTTDKVKLQDVFYWFIYLIRSRYAKDLAWEWMVTNWDWIKEQYEGDMHYNSFAEYSAAGCNKSAQLERYKAFFEPKTNELGLVRDIKQGIEAIEARILWRERDQEDVEAFLLHASSDSK